MPHPSPHPCQRGLSRRHGAQGALRTRTPRAGLSGETAYSPGLTSPRAEARWFTQHLLSAYCVPGPTTPWEAGLASPPPGFSRCLSPEAPHGAPGGRAGRRCRAPRGQRCSPPGAARANQRNGPSPGRAGARAGRAGRRCWAPPRPQGLQSRSLTRTGNRHALLTRRRENGNHIPVKASARRSRRLQPDTSWGLVRAQDTFLRGKERRGRAQRGPVSGVSRHTPEVPRHWPHVVTPGQSGGREGRPAMALRVLVDWECPVSAFVTAHRTVPFTGTELIHGLYLWFLNWSRDTWLPVPRPGAALPGRETPGGEVFSGHRDRDRGGTRESEAHGSLFPRRAKTWFPACKF